MAEPFLAEIRITSFGFPPKGWALCNGQLLPINQNQGLFSLLGTTYGGDGRVNFALPDLRGRVPIHRGGGFTQGEKGGEEAHTLSISEMPIHGHGMRAEGADIPDTDYAGTPVNAYLAKAKGFQPYAYLTDGGLLRPPMAVSGGGSQAHSNMQPFLTLNFCIALQGIFPSQY